MNHEYLTDYEKRCLRETAEEINKRYPLVSLKQIRDDIESVKALDTSWERAKFRRFIQKIKCFIY